nr:FHA domain-containing protein [uncultured Ruminococcus sp.]
MGLTYWTGGIILGLSGIYEGAIFKINPAELIVIGRDPTYSNIVINENCNYVSRKHCSIKYNHINKTYEVTDFSKNGVIINKSTLLSKGRRMTLNKGSVIEIGDSSNSFKLM